MLSVFLYGIEQDLAFEDKTASDNLYIIWYVYSIQSDECKRLNLRGMIKANPKLIPLPPLFHFYGGDGGVISILFGDRLLQAFSYWPCSHGLLLVSLPSRFPHVCAYFSLCG